MVMQRFSLFSVLRSRSLASFRGPGLLEIKLSQWWRRYIVHLTMQCLVELRADNP